MFPEVFSFFFPFDTAKLLLFLCVRKQFDDYFANVTIKLMYIKSLCAYTDEIKGKWCAFLVNIFAYSVFFLYFCISK